MSLLRPLDPSFPIERQIAIEAGPVVLVNVVTLDKADEQTFPQRLGNQDDAAFMRSASLALHLHPASTEKTLGESRRRISTMPSGNRPLTTTEAAFGHPEFRGKVPTYPSSVVASPHLFQKVAVPNICVA